MSFAHTSNTRVRVLGLLDAVTGAVQHTEKSRIDRKTFARAVREAAQAYPRAQRIFVVLDNWPVHFHPDALAILAKDPRIELVPLPTYAPWLNAIEKLWRWLRQMVVHAHPYALDFCLFKQRLVEALDSLAEGSPELLQYVGLRNVN
jgi:transposase